MPLPDANKKSPRVYTNLQNLDLDNVTFANVQATGNPINVEEANEDELRRLVLVNLASSPQENGRACWRPVEVESINSVS